MWHYRPHNEPTRATVGVTRAEPALRLGLPVLLLFALVLFARMTLQSTTVTFLPKYLHDRGWLPGQFGLALSMILIGGAIGNVVGGHLADRMGRRPVIVFSLFLAAPALWTYLHLPGALFYGTLFLAGVCITAGHSVSVVLAQAMLPGRQGLASGLTLGFMFAGGAIGAAAAGWLGDRLGLEQVLAGMAGVALAGGAAALALPPALFVHDRRS
jgi:FSR family fosmidomycin resistance protein-like MFS transporter